MQVFLLSAVLLLVSSVIFIFCGTGKTQLWNEPPAPPPTVMVADNPTNKTSEMANY